jgi:predicted  nucleic acid-binding Zn-ribbon protein
MKKIITTLLLLVIFTFTSYGQDRELVEITPDSLVVDMDIIESGTYHFVFFNNELYSRHSKRNKADATALKLRLMYPDAIINIMTPDARPRGSLKVFVTPDKLNSGNDQALIDENNALKDEITQLSITLDESIRLSDSLLVDIENLNNDNSTLLLQNSNLEIQVTQLTGQINDLNTQLSNLNNKVSELTNDNKILVDEVDILNNEITSLNNQVTTLTNQIDVLNSENSDLQLLNQQLSNSNTRLLEDNKQLTASNTTLSQQNKNLSDANGLLITQNTELTNNISSLEIQNYTLTNEVNSLNETNLTLLSNVNSLQDEKEVLKDSIQFLKENLSNTDDILLEENQILRDSLQFLKNNWPQVDANIVVIKSPSPKILVLNEPLEFVELGNACDSLQTANNNPIEPTLEIITTTNFDFKDIPVRLRKANWTIKKGLFNNGEPLSLIDALVQGLIIMNCAETQIVYEGPQVGDPEPPVPVNLILTPPTTIHSEWADNGDGSYTYDGTRSNKYLVFPLSESMIKGETYDIKFDIETSNSKAQFDLWLYPADDAVIENEVQPDGTIIQYQDPRITSFSSGGEVGPYTLRYEVKFVDRVRFAIRGQDFGGPFTIRNIEIVQIQD